MKFKEFTLDTKTTDTLTIAIAELKDYIPFTVKRVYCLSKIQKQTGAHCHKIEEEFFVMVQGSCTAVIDKGKGLEDINLTPNVGIYVGSYIWHSFKNASDDAIILALSSTNYNSDRSDYIEDYEYYITIRDEKLGERT